MAGGGCVIAGMAGVGKSRLAAEVASAIHGPVERVLATSSARTLPFGAFSHLLASADIAGRPEIPSFIASLRERFPEQPPTLSVDDAHLLDDASAALALALVRTGSACLIMTIRSHEPVPDAIASLWKDGKVERIDIQPLARADVRTLIEVLLGSECHTSVVSKVFELTEGNPLYVSELLRDAVGSQALAVIEGRWQWTGTRPVMLRLRDLIEARTNGLSPQARRAVELLALSAPIDVDLFGDVAAAAAIEELERSGFARVTDQRGPVEIEITHPLYGEVIAEVMPGSVAHGHRRELARVMRDRGDLKGDQIVRAATWTLESAGVDHDLFVQASYEALRASSGVPGTGWGPDDASLAIRLADAAGPSFASAMASAMGRIAVNRGPEVEAILAPHEDEAARSGMDVAISYVRARAFALHWGGTQNDLSLALLDRSSRWHDEKDWAAFLAMVRGWILLELGRPTACREVLEPFVAAEEINPMIRLELLVVFGLALARLGLTERCEALEPEVKRLADIVSSGGIGTWWATHMVDAFVRIEATRDVDGVTARLGAAHQDAQKQGDESIAASIQMVLGRLALLRGHVQDAVDALREAVDGMLYGAERTALGLAHTYLSRAHSLRGDATAAADHVHHAEVLLRERPNNMRLTVELHRAQAWEEYARGRVADARRRLLKVADEAGEDVAGASEATYSALRLGAEPLACADQLTSLAERSENALYEACATHARSLVADDPDEQLLVVGRFADLGADLFAAEAAAIASQSFRQRGKKDSARRAAVLCSLHSGRCQGAKTPPLQLRTEVATLTPREREVVALVARGLSNAEVAEQLVISVRTVESFVLRACRKLGVDNRRNLASLLDAIDLV